MNARQLRHAVILTTIAVTGLSCDSGSVDPAEPMSATLVLELSAAGGAADAFDKATRVVVRAVDQTRVRFDQSFAIQPAGRDVRLPFEIRLNAFSENLTVSAEIGQANGALFRGSREFRFRAGRRVSVTLPVEPVAHGLVLPASLPTLTAYGDSVLVNGAVVFATGDTLTVGPVAWTSLDPGVIAIVGGVPVARGDGQAQLIGRQGELTATITVRVLAEVRSIRIDPPDTSLSLGTSRQYSATPLDRRGNPVPNRRVTWSSSDPLVIQIDSTGRATSVGVGPVQLSAASGTVTSTLAARGLPGLPLATTDTADQVTETSAVLRATAQPSGALSETWFEYSTDSTFVEVADTTDIVAVPAGLQPVPVTFPVGQLQPATKYYVRAYVRNSVGLAKGIITPFTTLSPRAGVLPVATTGPVQILQLQARVSGYITPNGLPVSAWFEWSTDSTFAAYAVTATYTIPAATIDSAAIEGLLTNLVPNTIYYYRAVAQTGTTVVRGLRRSFVIGGSQTSNFPPSVATLPASSVGSSSAILNGSVNPNGSATSAWFEWGTDPTFSSAIIGSPSPVGAGSNTVALNLPVGLLAPNTTYYFRASATNAIGTSRGGVQSFTTPPAGGPVPPAAATSAATAVTQSSATLNGAVNPNGSPTTAWFEWGTNPTLATVSTTAAQSIGAGSAQPFSQAITQLTPGTTYYFRLAASNLAGTTRGAILSFATPPAVVPMPPSVSTVDATSVVSDGAVLNGSVNPNGAATSAWLEWSTDPNLATFAATAAQAIGSGSSFVSISDALTTLSASTVYYFRAAASNTHGTTKGTILSFTTPAVGPGFPTVATGPAGPVRGDSAVVSGTVNPNGSATTVWFEWGSDPLLATSTSTAATAVGSGTSPLTTAALLVPLTPGVTYYYRLVGSNAVGTVRGQIRSFTPSAGPSLQPPSATTLAAADVDLGSALRGNVNPNGLTSAAWFEWSTSPTLTTFTRSPIQLVPVGPTVQLRHVVPNLISSTTYYYRVIALNADGTATGSIVSFIAK